MSDTENEQPSDPVDAGTPSQDEIDSAAAGDLSSPDVTTNPNTPHFEGPTDDTLGREQVQDQMLRAQEVGYFGTQVDPTPNENYSMETPVHAPTPETDPVLAAQADQAVRGNRLANVEQSSAETAPHNQDAGE